MNKHIPNIQISDFIEKYKNRSGFVLIYSGRVARPGDLEHFEQSLIRTNVVEEEFELVFHVIDGGDPDKHLTALVVKEGGKCEAGALFRFSELIRANTGVLIFPILGFVQNIT